MPDTDWQKLALEYQARAVRLAIRGLVVGFLLGVAVSALAVWWWTLT